MKKQKYKFSLAELEEFDDELNGKKDETGVVVEAGLLDSVINLKLKFLLTNINTVIEGYREKMVEYRNKLIHKLGTKNKDGIPEIPMYYFEVENDPTTQKFHPVYLKFEDQYSKYLTKEIDIESYPIDLDLLSTVARKERFPKLMKYIEQQFVEEEIK